MTSAAPFWKTVPLENMTAEQWESLCDGCGRCCLNKLRDDETEEIAWTDVACRLLDTETCRCTDYERRRRKVPDCVSLTPALLAEIDWLPPNCAYRLVRDGYDLPDWHHLKCGDRAGVHRAGISARHRCISERYAGMLEEHVVNWPGEWPDRPSSCANGKHRS